MHVSDLIREFASLAARLVLVVVIFVPMERLFALHRQKTFRRAFVTDIAYYFFASLLPKLLLVAAISLLVQLLHRAVPSPFYVAMAGLPAWLRLAAAMVVGELGFYWAHRWMHQVPMLWRFHAIHHSAEEMDWLVNTRAHPVDIFLGRFCGLVPMYALGLAQPMAHGTDIVPLLFALIGSLWGFFIHANIAWRFGWLEHAIATPAFHHWHHTNDGPDVIDKNYASMLPFIDRIFGTFHVPKTAFPGVYGIAAAMPDGFWRQMAYPWRKQEKSGEQRLSPQPPRLSLGPDC